MEPAFAGMTSEKGLDAPLTRTSSTRIFEMRQFPPSGDGDAPAISIRSRPFV